MDYPWYITVPGATSLAQGDVVLSCPVASWTDDPVVITKATQATDADDQKVEAMRATYKVDVVVMTQACDLEYRHVSDVILCSFTSAADYKARWEAAMKEKKQDPTARAWQREWREIGEGLKWHLCALSKPSELSDILIVDFRRIFSLPLLFLESWVRTRGARPRLLPPYREHLSQAFARYFMRVGLPINLA